MWPFKKKAPSDKLVKLANEFTPRNRNSVKAKREQKIREGNCNEIGFQWENLQQIRFTVGGVSHVHNGLPCKSIYLHSFNQHITITFQDDSQALFIGAKFIKAVLKKD